MSMVKIVLELLKMDVRELITAENITTISSPRNPLAQKNQHFNCFVHLTKIFFQNLVIKIFSLQYVEACDMKTRY